MWPQIRNIAILILWIVNTQAQSPAYLHYDVSDGLPGNIIYCAAQDERGFMWFGTDKGLACFDGTSFRTFGVKDGLPDPEVLNLKLDSKGRMWIFCFKKKPCFYQNGQFHNEFNDNLLVQIDITIGVGEMTEEPGKGIWFSERSGTNAYFYDYHSSEVWAINSPIPMACIYIYKNKVYGLNAAAILELQPKGVTNIFPLESSPVLIPTFTGIAISREKVIFSSPIGTYQLPDPTNPLMVTPEDKLSDIEGRVYFDQKSKLWISSTGNGAICYNPSDESYQHPIFFLSTKKINATIDDSGGGYWFCTAGEGIYYLPPNYTTQFTRENGLISNNITAITKSTAGLLLGGDDQGNLYSFNNAIKTIYPSGKKNLNRTRQIYNTGTETFVVNDGGITAIGAKFNHLIPGSKAAKYLVSRDSELIFGTASNLLKLPSPSCLNPSILLGRRRTTAATIDSFGQLWIGDLGGIYSEQDSFKNNSGDHFPLLRNRIIALESTKDYMWAATPSDGLLRLKTTKGKITEVISVSSKVNIKIGEIQNIFPEGNDKIWLATNSGVYGFDKNFNYIHFNRNNGLVENDVNDIYVANDTLWAATVSGLVKLCLSNQNSFSPALYITEMHYRRGNEDFTHFLQDTFSDKHVVTIPADASLIELKIACLDYSSKGNIPCYCVIRNALPLVQHWTAGNLADLVRNIFGHHPDTIAAERGMINFGVYLKPSSYLIQGIFLSESNNFNNTSAIWTLNKLPKWYEVVWFQLVIIGLIIYFLFYTYRTDTEKRNLRTAVSELQLQTIQSQINPHFIGNSVNAIQQFFYPPDPVRASDYIAIFTRLLRTTMEFSDRQMVSLAEEMAYIEDYLRMIQLRFGQRFVYTIEALDQLDRQTPFPCMVLQPLLENATIHGLAPSGTSVLKIRFYLENDGALSCSITDNGIGIQKGKHNKSVSNNAYQSKGLLLLEKKVKTLNDLYQINCSLRLEDLALSHTDQTGTVVVFKYYPIYIKTKNEA